jgi:hypothetical protein
MNDWTWDAPKEEGLFWFYGWPWGRRNSEREPELVSVRCRRGASSWFYVGHGNFLYPGREAVGMWAKATHPELPDLSNVDE